MALRRNASKKDFDYYLTNLDWDDGSPIEKDVKQFNRDDVFEHNYERPGFYSIKGLVFKYARTTLSTVPQTSIDQGFVTTSSVYFSGHPSEGEEWTFVNSKRPITELTSSLSPLRFRRGFEYDAWEIGEPYKGDNAVFVATEANNKFIHQDSWINTIVAELPHREQGERLPGIQIKIPFKLDISETDYIEYSFEVNLPNPNIGFTKPLNHPFNPADDVRDSELNTLSTANLSEEPVLRKSEYEIIESIYAPRALSGSDGQYTIEDVDWGLKYTSSRIVEGVGGHSRFHLRENNSTGLKNKGWQRISGTIFAQQRDLTDRISGEEFKPEIFDFDNNYVTIEIRPRRAIDTTQGYYSGTESPDSIFNLAHMALRNLSIKVPNTKNIIRPVEWQRFYSNFVVNPRNDYQSPLYEINDFSMIGGVSEKSSHFKTLASLAAFDSEEKVFRNNSLIPTYNQYDVLALYDTIAKYNSNYFNDILEPYCKTIHDDYSPYYNGRTSGSLYNKPKITDGYIDKSFHGVLENTSLMDVDIGTTKVKTGVVSMWEQIGLNEENNIPNQEIYWNNIIPKNYKITDRSGYTKIPLEDPTKGSITPRIPRLVWSIDEENDQSWNGNYYWPQLPKMTKGGVFSEPIDLDTYGNTNAPITNENPSEETLFILNFDADDVTELQDITTNYNIEYRTDGLLDLDENGRVDLINTDVTDTLEKDFDRQAF